MEQVLLCRAFAAVDIDHIGDGLKGIKRDAEGKNDIPQREKFRSGKASHRCYKEIIVFKISEDPQGNNGKYRHGQFPQNGTVSCSVQAQSGRVA